MKIKKILLILTPSCEYTTDKAALKEKTITFIPQPLSLCYLGGLLRSRGYEVQIYDPHIENYDKFSEENIAEEIKKAIKKKIDLSSYDLLGISSPFIYTYEWMHCIAGIAKKTKSDKLVIAGGGYPSLMPEKVLEDKNVDYVVLGEGELVLLNLIAKISSDKSIRDLDGMAYRANGKTVVEPKKTFIEDVGSLSYPAWGMVDTERYFNFQGRRALNVISSRGCPYTCTFCNSYETWGRGFRKRSAEDILGEVDYLVKNFRIEEINFIDDNMTVDKKRFMKIANGLKSRGLKWSINNISSFTTDDEMLEAMKEGGCEKIAIGLESAVKKTLRALRKPVDLVRTKELIKKCRRIGMRCNLLIISGLPYDTKEDMLQTFDYVESARPDWCTISMLVPFPGTDIYDYCMEHDYFIEKDMDLSKFTLRNKGFIETEHWDRQWVAAATYDANIRINFLRNYNIIANDGDLKYAVKMFGHVFRFHPKHVIACICLAYAYFRQGNSDKTKELIDNAKLLLERQDVQAEYGKYMNRDEQVIDFYYSQSELSQSTKGKK